MNHHAGIPDTCAPHSAPSASQAF